MTDLPRVFFDGNDGSDEYGWKLRFVTSEADLARIPGAREKVCPSGSIPRASWSAMRCSGSIRSAAWVGMRSGPMIVLDLTAYT